MAEYSGYLESWSIPRSHSLKKALCGSLGIEVTPVVVRVDLRWFKEPGDIMWRDIIEVDEVNGSRHIYQNQIGEFVLPVVDAPLKAEAANVILQPKTELRLDLTRSSIYTFDTEAEDLECKVRKDGLMLRSKAPELGGRLLHRMDKCKLTSIHYL